MKLNKKLADLDYLPCLVQVDDRTGSVDEGRKLMSKLYSFRLELHPLLQRRAVYVLRGVETDLVVPIELEEQHVRNFEAILFLLDLAHAILEAQPDPSLQSFGFQEPGLHRLGDLWKLTVADSLVFLYLEPVLLESIQHVEDCAGSHPQVAADVAYTSNRPTKASQTPISPEDDHLLGSGANVSAEEETSV